MKYKVGDKVRIKPKFHFCSVDEFNNINMKDEFFNQYSRLTYCKTVMTIGIVNKDYYVLKEDKFAYKWTDDMIECKVEETKPKFNIGDKIITDTNMKGKIIEVVEEGWYRVEFEPCNGIPQPNGIVPEGSMSLVEEEVGLVDTFSSRWVNEFNLPDGYVFKDENGNVINATKIVLEKKKKKYPKTYEECLEVLGFDITRKVKDAPIFDYDDDIIALQRLKRCRDAYWKIAGEEMGLGKPWKPDWDAKDNHFYTIYTFNGKIECSATSHRNAVLIFPTEEMRDAFYENFKEEIEICKELL